VYLLFLDESGTPSAADFVLGGVAIAGERWHQLRTRWIDIKGTSGRPSRSEVKWSRARSTAGLAARLADLLVEYEATAFAVQLRPEEGHRVAPELFKSGEDTYATALMFLAERFQHFLRYRDDYGVIVLDQRDGRQDDRLRRFFRRLAERGTPFMTLDRIVDPIMLSPSHHSLGIQAADLVVGPMLALARQDSQDMPAERVELARELHGRLLPCFARHPATGEIDGVGIKQFPDPRPSGSGLKLELG
jgi:hypothetical protein